MAAPHLTPLEDVARQKAALRRRMLALRATQDPACGAALAAHVLRDLIFLPGSAVAGVWPLPGEMDLRPLWHALHARGHTVLLPETPPRGSPLLFRVWYPGCAMIPERFGTARPDGPIRTPDYIFVPLLAFDRAGNRIGYGGGYYDMTLAAHRGVPAVGFAYAAQEVPAVPAEAHDIRLGAIMTEQGPVVLSPVSDDAGHCEPLRSNPG